MSTMNKQLVERLLVAEGGWSGLMFRALKNIDDGAADPKAEAAFVVEMYETFGGAAAEPTYEVREPLPDGVAVLKKAVEVVEAEKPATPPMEVVVEPVPPSKRTQRITRSIIIDTAMGTSSGSLNFPDGYVIKDLTQVNVNSPTGALLGIPGLDGQLHGESGSVSGMISRSGNFRLVFKDYSGSDANITCVIEEK